MRDLIGWVLHWFGRGKQQTSIILKEGSIFGPGQGVTITGPGLAVLTYGPGYPGVVVGGSPDGEIIGPGAPGWVETDPEGSN